MANGINWQPGDNVILSDKEHPGNRITWYSHVHRYGIELRFLQVVHDEEQMLEQFETAARRTHARRLHQPCLPPHRPAAAGRGP